jgi:opacity protein-like surface antigen
MFKLFGFANFAFFCFALFGTCNSFAESKDAGETKFYRGYGILSSDFSDWTIADSEATSLTFSKLEQQPTGFTVFTGVPVNRNFDFELALEAHGEQHSIGTLSGATLDSKSETYALYPSFLVKPESRVVGVSPYIRFGFGLSLSEERASKSNAVGVFQNPHNTSKTNIGSHLIYGAGLEYSLNQSSAIRLEYKVNKDALTDYINNIDGGYIKRDFRSIGVHLVFAPDVSIDNDATKDGGAYEIGIFMGKSETTSKLSGGSYDGNIYNLTSGNAVATVQGTMTDDKSDTSNRMMVFLPPRKKVGSEFGLAQYGTFKSKSSNLGITGGGNAVTGAASRSITSIEASMNYPIEVTPSVTISPSLGFGIFYVEDEIYNNLEFDGVGGTARGPQSTSTDVNFIAGIMGRYRLSETMDLAARYDFANDVGNPAGLGKGNLTAVSLGIISKF